MAGAVVGLRLRVPCSAVDAGGPVAGISVIAVVGVVLGAGEVYGVESDAADVRAGAEQKVSGAADGMLAGFAVADEEHDGVGFTGKHNAVSDGEQRRRIEHNVGVAVARF